MTGNVTMSFTIPAELLPTEPVYSDPIEVTTPDCGDASASVSGSATATTVSRPTSTAVVSRDGISVTVTHPTFEVAL